MANTRLPHDLPPPPPPYIEEPLPVYSRTEPAHEPSSYPPHLGFFRDLEANRPTQPFRAPRTIDLSARIPYIPPPVITCTTNDTDTQQILYVPAKISNIYPRTRNNDAHIDIHDESQPQDSQPHITTATPSLPRTCCGMSTGFCGSVLGILLILGLILGLALAVDRSPGSDDLAGENVTSPSNTNSELPCGLFTPC